jgi:hypothetical protein
VPLPPIACAGALIGEWLPLTVRWANVYRKEGTFTMLILLILLLLVFGLGGGYYGRSRWGNGGGAGIGVGTILVVLLVAWMLGVLH